MKAIIKQPGQSPEETSMETLSDLQEAVGGYIEAAYRDGDGVVYYCNEEGLLEGLPYNMRMPNDVDVVGPILAIGCTEEGDSAGLTLPQSVRVMGVFGGAG